MATAIVSRVKAFGDLDSRTQAGFTQRAKNPEQMSNSQVSRHFEELADQIELGIVGPRAASLVEDVSIMRSILTSAFNRRKIPKR